MENIRDMIFSSIRSSTYTACIFSDMDGILSGSENARTKAEELGLTVDFCASEGTELSENDLIMQISGTPDKIVEAEDKLIGTISKTSGIATAAHRFKKAAGSEIRVVCGAWKKMPAYFKADARRAAATGGLHCRITDEPMVYLDKNYVEMLGGIQPALWAVDKLKDRKKVIQIKGRYEHGDMVREAMTALHAGADIITVDTGRIEDVAAVTNALRPLLKEWEQEYGYRKVEIGFGGGVQLEEIKTLKELGVDVVDVGRAIVDAPLLDMRLEVTGRETSEHIHHSYDLLDKSELTINDIELTGGNLNDIADAVAEELKLDRQDVLVIDVRDRMVALDILRRQLDPETFIGKEKSLLGRLSRLEGVRLTEKSFVSSRGMLGWITADEDMAENMREDLVRGQATIEHVRSVIARNAIVFPSGTEVENGEIEDTNTPLLLNKLKEHGFNAEAGPVLKDDLDLFTGKLRNYMGRGYGVIITTGGVGAENKDYSVEAVLRLDPDAAAPYIAKFQIGDGRHRKAGIRIAVGQSGFTTLVALPGPNDEVALCADCLMEGLEAGWSKELLAGKLAALLRTRLAEKMKRHHH